MTPLSIGLVVEDELSRAIAFRLLNEIGTQWYAVFVTRVTGGFGVIKRGIRGYNAASRHNPYLVFTDLDKHVCPSGLIEEWLDAPQDPRLLFRIAVRSVESWLLADRDGIARFLDISPSVIESDPERLLDAKQFLVETARRSPRRELRDAIVPRYVTVRQGPDYNRALSSWVESSWNVDAAIQRSRSLIKALDAIRRLSSTV